MTEQSIRRRILLIMAMSGGEIKKEICMELCGSKPYYKKMMQQMKEKGEAETIFAPSRFDNPGGKQLYQTFQRH